jgi:hypothetical protein
MDTLLTVPPPDQLRQRIASCERELKALRRLLRIAKNVSVAEEARQARIADSRPARTAEVVRA